MPGAIDAGAECISTTCAMCHLNLEIRCSIKQKPPVVHFSEILDSVRPSFKIGYEIVAHSKMRNFLQDKHKSTEKHDSSISNPIASRLLL
jgi:hypothetical protein